MGATFVQIWSLDHPPVKMPNSLQPYNNICDLTQAEANNLKALWKAELACISTLGQMINTRHASC